MMRWLFLVLVMANGVIFAYGWYERSQEKYILSESGGERLERGAGITLVAEADTDDLIPRIVEEPILPLPEGQPAVAGLCTQIGPFRAADTVDQAVQQLLASGISAQAKALKIRHGEDFWVLIPAQVGRDASLGWLRELDAQGVDAYLITEGERAGGISLGLFSQGALAEGLQKRIADRGYAVQMEEIPRFREEYWLEISQDDTGLMSDALWEVLQQRYGFAEKHENLCGSGIASTR
ncbi:hypothetical protein [Kistimonas asteriae]|uniref:hypothetical protein n=1 Tax=Kistimonas asteriae TaxID=517724 RepID=UPI001BA7270C|nr:hypothetical protein [Kistimonas asteriae]